MNAKVEILLKSYCYSGGIEKLKGAINIASILKTSYSTKRKLQWEFLPL